MRRIGSSRKPGSRRVSRDGPDRAAAKETLRTLVELGGTVLGGSPAEFGAIISEATEKWARVIKFAGIKAD